MISQLFILSPRGDNIIFRDYRGEIPKSSAEVFFRNVRFWKGEEGVDAPPVFNLDGVNYLHITSAGLHFVATVRVNVSPALVLELLQRIARVCKDYLGVLNEESLRKNFVLVYELLDEMIDFGYPQSTSTEALKSFVYNEPVAVDSQRLPPITAASLFLDDAVMLWQQGGKRVPGTAVTKSVVAADTGGKKRDEVFVDVIEKISCTFNAAGYIQTSEIDGSIQMKSYLSGNPEIKLALNEDLGIGPKGTAGYGNGGGGVGMVVLDDCNFHESVRLEEFDIDRTLTLAPPDGEFAVMNYRTTQDLTPPFKLYPMVEEAGAFKVEVVLKLRADFPAATSANSVVIKMPVPKSTIRVHFELDMGSVGQATEFLEASKTVQWVLKKVGGGADHTLRAKLTLSQERIVNLKKEVGPVNMTFSIPMYNASRLQEVVAASIYGVNFAFLNTKRLSIVAVNVPLEEVRYLQIMKKSKTYNPYRWVRYVTHANSYVVRL